MDGLGETNIAGVTTGAFTDIGLAPALVPTPLDNTLDDKLAGIQPEGVVIEDAKEGEVDLAKQAEELRALATNQEGDPDLVKNLRQTLRDRTVNYEALNNYLINNVPEQQNNTPAELGEREQRAIGLYDSLFDFDPKSGIPVTEKFSNGLVEIGIGLASQVGFDLMAKPFVMEDRPEGWTVGHEYLKNIGLDPNKYQLLREVSEGKANLREMGVVEIPDYVPASYTDAYKTLPHALRVDVDNYLSNTSNDIRSIGLQVLQDRHTNMQNETSRQQSRIEQENALNQEVIGTAAKLMEDSFTTILDSLKENPVYTSIKVSSEELIDSTFKDSLISQINALGDDNSILASRAMTNLAKYGVEVDRGQVKNLLTSIEKNANIIAKAERLQESNPKVDYNPQIENAKRNLGDAQLKATALGNKYFTTALKFISSGGKLPATGKQPDGSPQLSGNGTGIGTTTSNTNKVLSPSELNSLVNNVSRENAQVGS